MAACDPKRSFVSAWENGRFVLLCRPSPAPQAAQDRTFLLTQPTTEPDPRWQNRPAGGRHKPRPDTRHPSDRPLPPSPASLDRPRGANTGHRVGASEADLESTCRMRPFPLLRERTGFVSSGTSASAPVQMLPQNRPKMPATTFSGAPLSQMSRRCPDRPMLPSTMRRLCYATISAIDLSIHRAYDNSERSGATSRHSKFLDGYLMT